MPISPSSASSATSSYGKRSSRSSSSATGATRCSRELAHGGADQLLLGRRGRGPPRRAMLPGCSHQSMRADLDRRAMAALAGGHMAVDFAGGALPALLPFLKDRFGLSYTLAAALLLARRSRRRSCSRSSGSGPDRRGALWLLPGGVAPRRRRDRARRRRAALLARRRCCVVVSGLGVAAYHPRARSSPPTRAARGARAGCRSFSIGGNIGYGARAARDDARSSARSGCAAGCCCRARGRRRARAARAAAASSRGFAPERGAGARAARRGPAARARAPARASIAARSIAWFGLITFIPFWEEHLGHGKTHGNHLLSLMLLVGGVGTLAPGRSPTTSGGAQR